MNQPIILVVDDCIELLEWLELDLATRGFSVLTALGGRKALEVVAEQAIDIMILDVMMPGTTTLAEFLGSNQTYLRGSRFRLDVGLLLQRGRHFEQLTQIIDDQTLSSWLECDQANSEPKPCLEQSARQLLDLASNGDFQKKFGDVRMSFDGLTVCQLITSNHKLPSAPIVYLFTAGGPGTRDERKQHALQLGAHQYVLKSDYYDQLVPLLESHLTAPWTNSRIPRFFASVEPHATEKNWTHSNSKSLRTATPPTAPVDSQRQRCRHHDSKCIGTHTIPRPEIRDSMGTKPTERSHKNDTGSIWMGRNLGNPSTCLVLTPACYKPWQPTFCCAIQAIPHACTLALRERTATSSEPMRG